MWTGFFIPSSTSGNRIIFYLSVVAPCCDIPSEWRQTQVSWHFSHKSCKFQQTQLQSSLPIVLNWKIIYHEGIHSRSRDSFCVLFAQNEFWSLRGSCVCHAAARCCASNYHLSSCFLQWKTSASTNEKQKLLPNDQKKPKFVIKRVALIKIWRFYLFLERCAKS